jgi:lactam utilization protein B
MKRIDINSDMGEGFGAYCLGDDKARSRVVTTANMACGFHAGDPEIIASTYSAARQAGVVVESGKRIPVEIDTVCVHGDTPNAICIASTMRQELEKAGFTVKPFASV